MTLTFEAVKRWVMEQFHSKREHISVTRGIPDANRPVIVGSDGKLDGSLIDIAADYVDNTRLANMAQATIKGRASAAGTGDPTDLTAAQLITILTTSGTWTPGISFGGGTTGITYTTQVGRYFRIGNWIYASGYVLLSNKGSSTGNVAITGLPVAANATSTYYQLAIIRLNGVSSISGAVQGYINPSGTSINLEHLGTGTATALSDTNFGNTSDVIVTVAYEVT